MAVTPSAGACSRALTGGLDRPLRRVVALLVAVALVAGCGAESSSVAEVDGVPLTIEAFESLHTNVDDLTPQQRADSVLLLVLRQAFGAAAAAEFGWNADAGEIDEAFVQRSNRYAQPGGLEEALAAFNQTPQRMRTEAELDVLSDFVAAALVRSQALGFDLEAAYEAWLLDNAEVCVQQITLESADAYPALAEELNRGVDFVEVALAHSIDPFVDREPPLTGAGGRLGCSPPSALPTGLDTASLQAPLGAPHGPVLSSTGVHLLWVYERTVPPLELRLDDVLTHAETRQGPRMFRAWGVSVLKEIDVKVNPSYGAWGVIPETGGTPTVVAVDQVPRIIS